MHLWRRVIGADQPSPAITIAINPITQNFGNVELHGPGNVGITHSISQLSVNNANQSERINSLKHVGEAEWNAVSEKLSTCLEGTRGTLLEDFRSWRQTSGNPSVYWLIGGPGTGKTTFTRTACQKASESNTLGATFFFKRGKENRNKLDQLFATLAYRLSFVTELRPHIYQALEDTTLLASMPERQFLELIIEPIRRASASLAAPVFLVLDALDECEEESGDSSISRIMDILMSEASNPTLMIKVLITSRRDDYLRRILARHSARILAREMEDFMPPKDVETYIQNSLRSLEKEFRPIRAWTPKAIWPTDDDINAVIKMCGNLFLAATTIKRLLETQPVDEPDPRSTLSVLRSTRPSTTLSLDDIYVEILNIASDCYTKKKSISQFRLLLALLVLSLDPLSAEEIDRLLKITSSEYLPLIRAVVVVPDDGTPVQTFHTSFHDFITDPLRCRTSEFQYIDPQRYHAILAGACMDKVIKFKKNILGITGPHMRNHDMADRLVERVSKDMRYAVKFWAMHASSCAIDGVLKDRTVIEKMAEFANSGMLRWIEAASYIGYLLETRKCLDDMSKLLPQNEPCQLLRNLFRDASRFIWENHAIISEGAMHIYYSALPFSPSRTELFQTYLGQSDPKAVIVIHGASNQWDPCSHTIQFDEAILAIAISPRGDRIAVASGKLIRLIDASTGIPISVMKGHTQRVEAISFSQDGAQILSMANGHDSGIRKWDVLKGSSTSIMTDYGANDRILMTTDGACIYSGTSRGTYIGVWNYDTGEQRTGLKLPHSKLPNGVLAMALSLDGEALIVACGNSEICTYDRKSRKLKLVIKTRDHKAKNFITSMALSPNGTFIATGGYGEAPLGGVKLWDFKTGRLQGQLDADSAVYSVAFSPDGRSIAAGTGDGGIIMWGLESDTKPRRFNGHARMVHSIVFSPDASYFVSCGQDRILKIWDCRLPTRSIEEETHVNRVNAVAISKEGTIAVTGSSDRTVQIWHITSGKRLYKLFGHSDSVDVVAICDNATHIVSGSKDQTSCVWDVHSGCQVSVLPSTSATTSVAFESERRRVVSGHQDGALIIWDLTGEKIRSLTGHAGPVNLLVVSHDGTRMVSSSRDCATWVWDCSSWTAICQLNLFTSPVSIDISPDNAWIATATFPVNLWSLKTGAELLTIRTYIESNGPQESLSKISFIHDGRYIAAQYASGLTLVYAVTGERMPEPCPTSSPKSNNEPSTNSQSSGSHYIQSRGWMYEVDPNGLSSPICKLPSSYHIASSCFRNNICILGLESGGVVIMQFPASNSASIQSIAEVSS